MSPIPAASRTGPYGRIWAIDAIKRGEDPQQINLARPGVIGTNAHSTVMRVPQAATPEEDKILLRDTGRRVLAEWQAQRNGYTNGVNGK